MRTKDVDVRRAIHSKMLSAHAKDPDTLIVDELHVYDGSAIVDIAVVNGEFCGIEIKSDSDTLKRLPNQIDIYGMILDRVTLVIGERHVDKAIGMVPAWWGIITVLSGKRGGVRFCHTRKPLINTGVDPRALAWMLWNSEAITILTRLGIKGIRNKSRIILSQIIATTMTLDDIRLCVRNCLKARQGEKSHFPRMLNGDL